MAIIDGEGSIHLRISADDLKKASRKLRQLLHKVQDLDAYMEDAAQYMLQSTRHRFDTKRAPGGERWPGLSEITKELKLSDEPLIDTGRLFESIQISKVDRDGFTIGSNVEYAAYMQYGVAPGKAKGSYPHPFEPGVRGRPTEIPARPFLGFTDYNLRRIRELLVEHMMED